ncbi:hypothetical protein D1890_10805 [Escherichia coli]|uniref:Uncharacterized protein n=3 Tax=Escherichia coli TaxID=562 RepID=A0A2G8YQK5_ECOLX|nr:hypothetical protein UTI89_C2023 [Escherichia coli UTI89]ABJ01181.1 conserved hypothetical protein [Escherichia coli APEC O1]AKK42791.1 hypothetical protein NMECO18_06715 [Escherichia coli]AQX96992.1 hypothetical protein B0908_10290 [Escherichia coli NU14]EFU45961.1 hypothetical protein HMPREF9539_03522 [Escherichia coli MS 110-3]
MFTQDFFTENATHKQNCTSFNPKSVITYNVNYGKPFLNMSRSDAQISIRLPLFCTLMQRNTRRYIIVLNLASSGRYLNWRIFSNIVQ